MSATATQMAANGQTHADPPAPYSGGKWSEFYPLHDRRPFSPVFNSRLEAMIDDPELLIAFRVEALVLRYSWGNHSDVVIDSSSGEPLGRRGIAQKLGVSEKPVGEALDFLQNRGLIVKNKGLISCVDPKQGPPKKGDAPPLSPSLRPWKAFCESWAADHPAEVEVLAKAETIRQVRLTDYKRVLKENANGVGKVPETGAHPPTEKQGSIRLQNRGASAYKTGEHPPLSADPSLYTSN